MLLKGAVNMMLYSFHTRIQITTQKESCPYNEEREAKLKLRQKLKS